MKKKNRPFLRVLLVGLFIIGLFVLFGTAGYCDYADEEGVAVSLWFMAGRFGLGICMMIPLMAFYAKGGSFDGDDEDI